jgi:signal transduction histidine kinase/DNA-binding response OmpR family regulator/CHASE3 domain sensor protein
MNFKLDTLAKKIGLGYALMAFVLAVAIFITMWQVREIASTTDRIVNLRVPSARASMEVMNGVNLSVSYLRGYVLLSDEERRTARNQTWDQEINVALAEMETFTEELEGTGFNNQLSQLKKLLAQLRGHQELSERLSTTNREECLRVMSEIGVPLVYQIRDVIDTISDEQEGLKLADFDNIQRQMTLLRNIQWTLLAVGLFISLLLGMYITRSITVPVAGAVQVAQNIGAGDLNTKVNVGGSIELETLGNALTNMRDSLKRKTEETHRYEWLSTGMNALNEVMRGDKEIAELANELISFMAHYTGACVGAVYVTDDSGNELMLSGRYAFGSGIPQERFNMGEGLIGQVASDKKTMSLSDLDEKDIRVRSGLVDTTPRYVIAAPFMFEGQTLGVVELGKFNAFTAVEKEFVEANMEAVGIALNSAISRLKIRELLQETQRQSEELQQQQEELQQSNEELEEQTQQLKEQQEELQAANEEMEEQTQIVEQKNQDLELARTDIELKAKQLEISSKYKSEFLANMSHELRTPLNSLLILSNDLARNKEGNLDGEQVESAQIIAKSGYDLLNLINEILDLSKIEAGKMELNLQEAPVSEISASVFNNFKRLAEDKGLKLEMIIDDALPKIIRTDRQRLDQVLKNLISNAIKFTENGNVTVNFQRDAGDHLAISVKDTGIGIPKDKLDMVFEAFQQADGSTARKYGGTGLGLSISRELAKLLGGRITLQSKVGLGSDFTLIIPLKVAEATPVSNELHKAPAHVEAERNDAFLNHPSVADERESITEGDRTILIIEDDHDFARVLARQASEKGFKYLCASTGEDGLVLAGQYMPNAIILDLDLPGMDGHSVLKKLKSDPGLRHIPVHIMSANDKTLEPIRSGAVEYLTKPVSKLELDNAFGRIEDLISRKMKNLLIVEDDDILRNAIVKLIGNGDVKCHEAASAKDVFDIFGREVIDCMVLDIGLPDMSGFELIEKLEKEFEGKVPPIIIYTGRELSRQENDELQQHAETIIVKGVKSEERLLDETALFLHRTVRNLPDHTRAMITGLYNKDTMIHGKKVLLVDDDMRNVFALGKVLKERGMEVIKAENGKMALDMLKAEPLVDMVLMDIMMPEMDGYECMKRIREQKQFKELPIIALTAKAMKEDRQKCIEAGANDYIAKPVEVERLLSLMRIWIRK